MRTGDYVHSFLYSLRESGGHVPTSSIEVVCACIFVVQIYILKIYRVTVLDKTLNCPRGEVIRRGGRGSHITL